MSIPYAPRQPAEACGDVQLAATATTPPPATAMTTMLRRSPSHHELALYNLDLQISACETRLLTALHVQPPTPPPDPTVCADTFVSPLWDTLTATNFLLSSAAHAALPSTLSALPRAPAPSLASRKRVTHALRARARHARVAQRVARARAVARRVAWRQVLTGAGLGVGVGMGMGVGVGIGVGGAEEMEARRERDREILRLTRGHEKELLSSARNVERELRAIRMNGGTHASVTRAGRNVAHVPLWLPPPPPSLVADDAVMRLEVARGVRLDANDLEFAEMHARFVNPWTTHETLLFLRLLLRHGKDFRAVAKGLRFKDVGDTVRFYYSRKLALGLKALLRRAQQPGGYVSDDELRQLAAMPVVPCNVFRNHDDPTSPLPHVVAPTPISVPKPAPLAGIGAPPVVAHVMPAQAHARSPCSLRDACAPEDGVVGPDVKLVGVQTAQPNNNCQPKLPAVADFMADAATVTGAEARRLSVAHGLAPCVSDMDTGA